MFRSCSIALCLAVWLLVQIPPSFLEIWGGGVGGRGPGGRPRFRLTGGGCWAGSEGKADLFNCSGICSSTVICSVTACGDSDGINKFSVFLTDRWKLVLYENIRGAKNCSQFKVVLSTNELRYLAIVLLHTSAWLLHWGWRAAVVWWCSRSRE